MTGRTDEARAVAEALVEAVDRSEWGSQYANPNRWWVLAMEDSDRMQAADLLLDLSDKLTVAATRIQGQNAEIVRLQAQLDDYRRRAVTDDFGDVRLLDQG